MSTDAIVRKAGSDYTMLMFNTQSIDDADTLLFVDSHISQKCRTLFAKLVAGVASSCSSVRVFVEGSPAQGQLSHPESFYKREFCLDGIKNSENISLSGWGPIQTAGSIQACKDLIYAEMALKSLQNQKTYLENEEKLVNEFIATMIEPMSGPTLADLDQFFARAANHNFIDGLRMTSEAHRLNLLQMRLHELEHQITVNEERCRMCIKHLEDVVISDFPLYMGAMISTLEKVRRQRKNNEFTGKAIFHAGENQVVTSGRIGNRPEYDLTALCNELRNHRAVILVPNVGE